MHRQRVVIDTNVIVSALLSRHGNPAQVIDMVFYGYFEPCYCAEILSEYAKVLMRPRFEFSLEDRKHILEGIRGYGVPIEPAPIEIHFPDESDRIFYEVAKAASAYLVTGNAKHFPNEPIIISPAEFIRLLGNFTNDT